MRDNVDKYITSLDIKRRKIYLIAIANRANLLHFSPTRIQILDTFEIQMLRLSRNYQLVDLNNIWKCKKGYNHRDNSVMPSTT